MAKKKKISRLAEALVETARQACIRRACSTRRFTKKITMRHLGAAGAPKVAPITSKQIRAMRERERLSQAVFARYLNVTVGYVSQLSVAAKRPTEAALAAAECHQAQGF